MKGSDYPFRAPFYRPWEQGRDFFYPFSSNIWDLYAPSGWCQALCSAKPRAHAESQLWVSKESSLGPGTTPWKADHWSIAARFPFSSVCLAGLSDCKFITYCLPGLTPFLFPSILVCVQNQHSFSESYFSHCIGNRKDMLTILLLSRQSIQQC